MTAPSLVDFLLARIAEDERAARNVADDLGDWSLHLADNALDSEWPFADRFDSARMLTEVAAKRAIVDLYDDAVDDLIDQRVGRATGAVAYDTLRHLAAVYADHPDYREEWRP